MSNLEKIMEELHGAVAASLLDRVQAGEATASELSVAVKFLKDNGIDAVAKPESPLLNLATSLPFQDPDAPLSSQDIA